MRTALRRVQPRVRPGLQWGVHRPVRAGPQDRRTAAAFGRPWG